MIIETLQTLFKRDLTKLTMEIAAYQNEKNIWLVEKGISNSAGNLCLHLVGNVNAYIGVGLAKTNYIRRRPLEFSLKNISREELLQQIENTLVVVATGLSNLTEAAMKDDFSILVWEKPTEMEYTLVHLVTHLNYHLGQVNYHRRMLDV